ncbi:small cell adhesion glycoprotein [Pelobates fuscus]|uniref:small cell adhesion glycoprotein n=1 Tax=Pelobates fuscus TaxID=191477 RepID=UPI002FE4B5BA
MDPVNDAELTTPVGKATTSASSNAEGIDVAVIAGVIAAVFITLLIAVVLISAYLYKHKGSYVTNESPEEESTKALQTEEDSSEKQEYLM